MISILSASINTSHCLGNRLTDCALACRWHLRIWPSLIRWQHCFQNAGRTSSSRATRRMSPSSAPVLVHAVTSPLPVRQFDGCKPASTPRLFSFTNLAFLSPWGSPPSNPATHGSLFGRLVKTQLIATDCFGYVSGSPCGLSGLSVQMVHCPAPL